MTTGIAIAVNGQNDAELSQAISIEVSEQAGEASTFSLRYGVDILQGDLPYLIDKRLDAGSDISVIAYLDNMAHCLVKGPAHAHSIHLQHGGAGSTMDVKGSDTSIKMDRESRSTIWKDLTDSDAVQNILSKYGYTPDVETTSAGHYENKHSLVQRESDFAFIRRLARRNGYYFWISCDALGMETAHFKRPQLGGTPAAQLVINLDSPNISTLDINWDVERPTSIAGVQLDLNAKSNIDLSVLKTPQTILGDIGLIDITGDTRSVHLSAPANDAGDLQSRGEGALIEADWFIQASCQTTVAELGAIIRPHTVVELRGAGSRHSGKYFVSGVTHTINAIEHKMDIKLVRNGWGR
jgi:hypothetical protein